MTEKTVQKLAEAITKIPDLEIRRMAASLIGAVCKQDNSKFDFHKWRSACQVEK